MAAAPIQRRPVGGHVLHTAIPSRNSVATVNDDDLGFSLSPSYSHKAFDFGQHMGSSVETSKDEVSPLSENAPATPEGLPGSPNFDIVNTTSNFPVQQTELWRRRSTKSDRNIGFSDLKLTESNGATAIPADKELPPAPEKSLPTLPRSITGSTARKAVPPRPPPQPDFVPNRPMGHKHSKQKDSSPENEPVSPLSPVPIRTQSPFTRLPTPDYQSRDVQHPSNHIVSPVSPNTPPQDEPHLPPKVPEKSPSRENFHHVLRRSPSRESLRSQTPRTNFSRPSALRKAPSNQSLAKSAARTAYAAGNSENMPSGITSPTPSHSAQFNAPLQPASIQAAQASMSSIISPFNLPPPAAAGTVFSANPLNITHFDCYQNHKYMRSSKNNVCPVACQVCEKKDTQRRWLCSWCSLRCCDGCMKVLASSNKDLRVTLGVIANELEELEKKVLEGVSR